MKPFTDLKQHHEYCVGDVYPHNGSQVDAQRIDELASGKNKMGVPLIAEVKKPKPKKETKKAEEAE